MGCAHRLRSNNSGVRKLVAEHHGGVAEVQLDLHEFVPRNGNAAVLRGAEHLHIPAGGARGVANYDMRTEMDDHVRPPGDGCSGMAIGARARSIMSSLRPWSSPNVIVPRHSSETP